MQPNHFFSLEQIIDRQPPTVSPNTLLSETISLMQSRGNSCKIESSENTAVSNSSCVLVVENNRLLGIFTERDLVRLIAANVEVAEVAIAEAMTRDIVVLTYTGTEDIFAALNLLRSHSIRHLPIVDSANNLLGLTTAKNLRQKLQPVNMMKWRKVVDVMKTGVICANPEDPVRQIAKLMAEHRVSCVAICEARSDSAHPVGIITERDIVQFQNIGLELEQPARDVMSAPLFLVSPSDALWSVHQQMQQHHVRRLLVGGNNGELVGIVTQTSLLQVFDPGEMYGVIESLQQQVCQLELAKTQLLENRQEELEREVRERTSALRTVNRQGTAIAEFGQYALATADLPLILQRAVYLVADTLEVEYCKVLKLLPDDTLLLEAGVGWQDDLVGAAIIGTEKSSQAGYSLQQSQPVVVENLSTETRFNGSSLLIDHQVVSGISVAIADGGKPYGVMGTHTTQQRNFTQDDVNFLQAIANIIAQANERLQMENRLEESQERYDLAVRGSSDGLWDWNVVTNRVFYAPRFKEMIGYTDEEMPNTFAAWSSKLHPEDREPVLKAIQNHLENCVPYNVEYRLQTKQGDYCWFNARGQAIWNKAGQAVRMAGSITDISDRKLAELNLKQSEQKFRAIFDKSFQFIGLLEPNGNIIEANKTALDFIGLSAADVRGKPFWLTPWWSMSLEIQQQIEQAIAKAATGEFVRFEVEHPGTEDRVVTVDFSLTPIRDETGKVVLLIPEGRNISERKQTEAKLQQGNQILQAISSIQTQYLSDTEPGIIFDRLLEHLLELTESEYGFIGEIHVADDGSPIMEESYMKFRGRPYLKTHAITNIAWNEETRAFYAENAPKGMEFHNLQTLFGAVIVTGEPVIANSPSDDPRRGGLPDGHPPLNAFLGVPFYKNNKMTGMAGIANRPGGYNEDIIEYLRPLLDTCSRIIEAYKSDRAKQQTEAQNREQAALLDLTHDTVLVRDLNNIITFWNLGAEEMYGWSVAEALGKNSHKLLQVQFSQSLVEIETELFQNDRWEGELIHCKKDGSNVIVMGRWSLLRDKEGRPQQILEINHDITQRKQAESKIKEQAALLNITTDAIMVRALDNTILFWNRGAEVLYGWETAEILHRNCDRFFNRTSIDKLIKIQQVVKETGQWQGELQQVTKLGQSITVESRWTLVKDETDNPKSILVVNTDITEQKQLEKQFLRTQRLESLGTLAGGIAHDLNNILAPILGFSKLLPLKLPNVDEQTKGFFKIMETNADRGTALVKQILTFSRGLEGDKGIVQIRHLINEIGQIITETFPKSIELSIDAPKTLWTVNADVNQLHQVLMNLCVNARDAMPDGGKLAIEGANFTVDEEYARLHLDSEVGSYLKLSVTDTGVGISAEIIDRIFEPFFTTKEIGRGTGLGLSTVIGIVRSHGGFVDVASQTTGRKGTSIDVFIPASDAASAIAESDRAIPQGNGELILVVDDETPMLEVTKATLETYNYQVMTANNGIEAVAAYANNQDAIALVIMDIMMPGMDGKTAIRTLKQINSQVRVIAVSGLITNQEILNELDGEVMAFLSKPCSNEELVETVYEIVNS